MDTCVLCRMTITDQRQVWTLDCEHVMHVLCLKWCTAQQCPVCYQPFSAQDQPESIRISRFYTHHNPRNTVELPPSDDDSGYESD